MDSRYRTKDVERLAEFLDSKYRLPFGIKIGWDGIIGLIPGFGDILTSFISFFILARAAHVGVSTPVLMRMGMNVFIDNLISMVPILGNIGDFFWKSNVKNVRLLQRHMDNPVQTSQSSKWALAFVLSALFILSVAAIILGVYALVVFVQWLISVSSGVQQY